MDITIFTSNQPRHLSLIKDLAKIAETVYAIIEVNTVFPGEKADFYKKSEIMQSYFSRVIASEQKFFGDIFFLPDNVLPLILKSSDLNKVSNSILEPALSSDEYIVFGSSYIKGGLIDFLVEKGAYNVHMGVAPYYRGNSCNFWASYDKNYDMVGATIHMLSKGLDLGDMLFHAFPKFEEDPFDLGMRAVKSAHKGLMKNLENGNLSEFKKVAQNRQKEIRYTKNIEFNDQVALNFISKTHTRNEIYNKISNRDMTKYLNSFIY